MKNILYPNYDRSILSISSSLLKYYNLESNYPSLKELDDELKKNYKNIVFLILDCFGTSIMEKNLKKNLFLRQHVVANITSVFPPTTAAATTSFHSGMSPYESGWIGWMPYFKEYDCMLELFTGKDFYTRKNIIDSAFETNINYEPIYEKISKNNKNIKYKKVFPNFVENGAGNYQELCENILSACNNSDKNLVSAYWTDPDHTIHINGVNGSITRKVIKELNDGIKKLSQKLDDTLIIISADHGAVDVDEVYLDEIPEINNCLLKPPSIESRFVSFFIKKDKKDEFLENINKYFKDEFLIFGHDEFLSIGLLGRGAVHPRINDYIGDYVLIAKGNINLRYAQDNKSKSKHLADHGGITPQEMNVPVILIDTNNM